MNNAVVISAKGIRSGLGEGVEWTEVLPLNAMTLGALRSRFQLDLNVGFGGRVAVKSPEQFIWKDSDGRRTEGLREVTLKKKILSAEMKKVSA